MGISSFFGLGVSTQGLYTARTALDVVNHNITNAETPGYSRQYADISASRPLSAGYRGMIGTGAEVTNVKQFRSEYLDNKFWSLQMDLGQYTVKEEMLGQIELLFNEPSDAGYNVAFNDLYNNLQRLSTNPSEEAIRTSFVDSAASFCAYYNNIAEQLRDYQRDANFGVKNCVDEINFYSGQLATLNNQIANLELNGNQANDLRDERSVILDKLSQIINIEAKELTDINGKKTFRVSIGGQILVDDSKANFLELRTRDSFNNVEDNPDLYDIYWASGRKFYTNSDQTTGKLKGYLDIRDGNNGENFQGDIMGPIVGGETSIVINNISRHDIPQAGTLYLDKHVVKYTAISYDNVTGQMTFTLDPATPAAAGVTKAQIGESVAYKGIPYYIQQLNEFVRTVAKTMNTIHETGNGGTAGELFSFRGFTGVPGLDETNDFTYNQITIDNFAFSEAIRDNIDLLATTASANPEPGQNDLLLKLLDLRHDSSVFKVGEMENYMQSLISEVGIDSKRSASFRQGQENLSNLIDNQRMSFSGVDLNEETADMVRFQQAYNLSAKMISVFDEIFDVTINGLIR